MGFWAKNPKPSRGLVLGVPRETAVQGDDRRCWVGVDIMEAAGGLRVRQCEAGGGGLGQKPETEQSLLGFGRAAWNGCVEWFQGVVGAG